MRKRLKITTAELPTERTESAKLETLRVDGRTIAYQDVGAGPTIILAHCSGGSHREWAPMVGALSGRYRVLVPDLIGYGQSDPWPVNATLPASADVNVLLALTDLVGGPVHLGGHSYGGVVALEASRTLGARVKSLTLIEPVAFHLLKETGRIPEWYQINDVGERMTRALRMRRDRKAAAIYMSYWIGRLRWWGMSASARRRVVATVGKVGAEFSAMHGLSTTAADYRSIMAPTRLIAGERTRSAARAIVDELLRILPDPHLRIVAGAGHMSPITHPEKIAALATEHFDRYESSTLRSRRGAMWPESAFGHLNGVEKAGQETDPPAVTPA